MKLVNTSQPTSFLSEIHEGAPIPLNKLAYFRARTRYNLFDYIVTKFKEIEAQTGLSKAELARRIGCKPELITRRLSAPGNLTIDTISDLLIGIAGEELIPKSISVLNRSKKNVDEKSWREISIDKESKRRGPVHSSATTIQKANEIQFNDLNNHIKLNPFERSGHNYYYAEAMQ
jgi:DNA-binding phage protein